MCIFVQHLDQNVRIKKSIYFNRPSIETHLNLCHVVMDASQRHHAESVQRHLKSLSTVGGGAVHTPVRHEEHQVDLPGREGKKERQKHRWDGGSEALSAVQLFTLNLPGEGNFGASRKPPYSSSYEFASWWKQRLATSGASGGVSPGSAAMAVPFFSASRTFSPLDSRAGRLFCHWETLVFVIIASRACIWLHKISCHGLSVNVILYLVNDSHKNRLEPRSSSMVCRGEICASNERSKVRGQPDTHGPTTTSTCCLSNFKEQKVTTLLWI